MVTKTVCPICLTSYSAALRGPGRKCGDLSQGQQRNCVGRVMPVPEFMMAEWRTPYVPHLPPLEERELRRRTIPLDKPLL